MRHIAIHLCYCMLLPFLVVGQRRSALPQEVKNILTEMKAARNMSYKYSMTAEYPNGQKDNISGVAFVGNDNKLICNNSDAMLTIYDGKWFYRADHREKTVAVLNVNKYLKKDYREAMEKDMFQNSALVIYLDSVITKFGTVKKLTRKGDTSYIGLQFPDKLHIKSIEIVFDEKAKTMVSYTTRTYQPWNGNEYGKNKGISQVIACSDFRHPEADAFMVSNFVKFKKDKVVLKKYNKYTLTFKL